MPLIRRNRPVGVIGPTHYAQQDYPWSDGLQPVNLGISGGPRVHALGQMESDYPRPWPTPYFWRLMGLYPAMQWPLFQLGPTTPVFNNQLSPMPVGYNVTMPGINRNPVGG